MLVELFPYVVIGVIAAELLKFTRWIDVIYKVCKTRPLLAVVTASFIGAVSPLCTYGTVPIILGLFRRGTPLSPLMSFLAVSSLMNPQLFIITWGGISPEMALVRLGSVLLFGIILGSALYTLSIHTFINNNIIHSHNHSHKKSCRYSGRINFKSLIKNMTDTLQYVGFYVTIGILAGSVIEVFIPPTMVYDVFNSEEWFSVPLAGLMGIPLYACGGGAVPFINSLISAGMSKGSALAFLIVGPATRITPLLALGSVVKPLFIFIYIILIMFYSVGAGMLYN